MTDLFTAALATTESQLLALAEAAGFDVFVTTDQNLQHQQSFRGRKRAIFVLGRGNSEASRAHSPTQQSDTSE